MKTSHEGGRSTDERPTLYQRIKAAVAVAAQVIITAPLKLPRKVVKGAHYVALLIGLLDRLGPEAEQPGADEAAEEGADDVP